MNYQERRRGTIPQPNHGGPSFDPPQQGPPNGQWQRGHNDRRGGNFPRDGGQPLRVHNNDQRFPHQYDDHGPSRDYPDHRGPAMDQGRHSMNHRGSFLGRGPPFDHQGSPIDQRGATPMDRMNDGGPPMDRRGPPMDNRGPPPVERRGLPLDHRGPPMDPRGPLMNQRGPPLMNQRGSQVDHRGPLMEQRGPPMDHPDIYDNRQFGGSGQGNWNGRQCSPQRDFRSSSPQGDFRGARADRGGRGGFAHARKDPRRRD